MQRRFASVIILGVALGVLAGCSSSAPSTLGGSGTATSAAAQVVHVTLSDQQITADHSTLYAGQSYQIVVTNSGQVARQFMMAPWGGDYDHMMWDQRQHAAMYTYNQINPGQTMRFNYTFPTTAVGHTYGFGCYQAGWYDQRGMWYSFAVQAHATAPDGRHIISANQSPTSRQPSTTYPMMHAPRTMPHRP